MATKKAVKKASTEVVHASAKVNKAVRDKEIKQSSMDNLLKRISKRLGSTKEQSRTILLSVLASIQETTVVKGSLNIPYFSKFEVVTKKASTGIIQFGERKGETWTKAEHQAIKISNINGMWIAMANDDFDIPAIEDIEEVWATDEEAEEEEVEETEEEEAPKKATPAKKK